jgi:tRNA dimethylallyltransferase
MAKNYLIAVVGPTAIGKTPLAIALAKHFRTEIISADSRQFFKELTIGTAVPSEEELKSAPHHFIQHISIFQPYSVGEFEREALQRLEKLFSSHDIVIMAGGSGLYLDAVTKGLDDFPAVAPEIRPQLEERLRTEGIGILQQELRILDPDYYAKVDLQNPHRLIRALEISLGTGQPYSSFLKGKQQRRSFKVLTVGLTAGRETIYERINQRVDRMLSEGLLEEVKSLYPFRNLNALQTVGYKELFAYLEGSTELDTAVSEIKKNTRRFAKRQLTWFRKQEDILWTDYRQPPEETIKTVETLIHGARQ